MKSFNEHINVKREELKEDPLDDLTSLLWVGAAAGGLWAAKKGWDKWGKDAVAKLPFAPDKWKAAKIDRKKERDDEKEKIAKTLAGKSDAEKAQDKLDKAKKGKDDAATKADAAAMDYEKDEDGYIKNVKDAQEYKDKADKAPDGWQVSTGKGAFKKIKAGNVVQKKVADMLRKKYEAEREAGGQRLGVGGEPEKKKDDKKDDDTKTDSHKLKGNMTITESNELQAIMALDDEGISAEINRKGQVVVKKKDLKKAQKALKKSFKKGGEPKLVGEGVIEDGTNALADQYKKDTPGQGDELEEASDKKAMKKVADEIEAMADKGGVDAPALFSMASRLRKGQLPTGQKVSKKVSAIFKKHGIRENIEDDLTSYLEMKMSAAAKKKKALWAKSSKGKASLKKSKIRSKKVASGSIKIDKAKGRAMAKARAKGGIRNEFVPRSAYEIVSEARDRAEENKPEWEIEDSQSRLS